MWKHYFNPVDGGATELQSYGITDYGSVTPTQLVSWEILFGFFLAYLPH